ncbi:MAG: TlpA family protein disulfide reductase [Gammaproteobacteria bacterium]|nr:TlpA family protein disulfide reductase [Gammaproteobacteria bacterium]
MGEYPLRHLILLLCITFIHALAHGNESLDVEVLDQTLSIERYPAQGKHLIIWVAPGFGGPERAAIMSAELVKRGVEVWYVDLSESLFLPKSSATMRKLDGSYVAGLVEQAHQVTGKQIILLSRSYGAIPILRGARRWQLRQVQKTNTTKQARVENYLSGAILFSPELYHGIPSLGLGPVYAPIVSATNLPIMLYQAGNRGNRWQLHEVIERLQKGGSWVSIKVLAGVTGVFYEGDSAAATTEIQRQLPGELVKIAGLLAKIPTSLKTPVLPEIEAPVGLGLDIELKPFKGNPMPLPMDLYDMRGQRFQRSDYRGKVTVMNFWASWCKPCVEEIPALNRLQGLMKNQPFELVSVNYAEDKQRIDEFMNRIKVDFPVLLDSDGRVAAQWNVLVFPSTFIIGPDGRIIYGINGAIYWDAPSVVNQLNNLIEGDHRGVFNRDDDFQGAPTMGRCSMPIPNTRLGMRMK